MNITFINQFDPLGNRVGGIGNYVLSFIRYAPKEIVFKIIGVSSHQELYQWHKIELFGREVLFMPIVTVKDINKKEFLPLSVRFSLGLFRAKKLIPESDYLYCQRNEYVFPFLNTAHKIFTIIHNDLSLHLDPLKSENGWSKAPWLYVFLQNRAFKRSLHTFSVNHNSIEFVCNHLEHYRDKISFIHTWADPIRFKSYSLEEKKQLAIKLNQDLKIDPNKLKLIFLGRFQKQKNIPLMLNAFLEVKDQCVLLMAGTGDELSIIQNFIQKNQLENHILLLGNVPHEKVPEVLGGCDLYLSSSNFEGMSISLMEALASGLYVITTNTGEARYLLNEATNGIITSDFEISSFANAIKKSARLIQSQEFQFQFDRQKYSPEESIALVLSQCR